ncbi:MAG: hypothetical protein LBL09_05380 [Oscillospiraceae bacterium]|jgi:flagellar motility protein MotE (MotC chaperone)|nr:hypothetical protein [Oscillospiraceae bacterium]
MAQSIDNKKMGKVIPISPDNEIKKKKQGGIAGLIVILILIMAAVGFLVLSVNLNLGGVRDKLIDIVCSFDPEYQDYKLLVRSVNSQQEKLVERENKAEKEEERLAALKKELEDWRTELDSKDYRRTPIYRRLLNQTDIDDMKSLSKTYSLMAPADAAERLAELYEVEDMAAIIYYMSEAGAAAILSAMDAGLAADITQALLSS